MNHEFESVLETSCELILEETALINIQAVSKVRQLVPVFRGWLDHPVLEMIMVTK